VVSGGTIATRQRGNQNRVGGEGNKVWHLMDACVHSGRIVYFAKLANKSDSDLMHKREILKWYTLLLIDAIRETWRCNTENYIRPGLTPVLPLHASGVICANNGDVASAVSTELIKQLQTIIG